MVPKMKMFLVHETLLDLKTSTVSHLVYPYCPKWYTYSCKCNTKTISTVFQWLVFLFWYFSSFQTTHINKNKSVKNKLILKQPKIKIKTLRQNLLVKIKKACILAFLIIWQSSKISILPLVSTYGFITRNFKTFIAKITSLKNE